MTKIEPKKIIVRSANWIGDHVLSYPFFYYLRKKYPLAHIAVVSPPWVGPIQFQDLVDQVFVLNPLSSKDLFSRLRNIYSMAKELQKNGPWDLGISLPNSFSAALLLFLARARERLGHAGDGRSFLLSRALLLKKNHTPHRSESYVELLTQDSTASDLQVVHFWGIPPAHVLDPGTPSVVPFFDVKKSWPKADPLQIPSRPFFVVAPGSTAESRRWPPSFFVSLVNQILHETELLCVLLGGVSETSIGEIIVREVGDFHILNLIGKASVASYSNLFKNAQFSVCNDSGLAHLASLLGSPVHVIWGAGDPRRTEPIGPGKVRISMNPVSCWPCEENTCSQVGENKLSCLKGIRPDAVWREIKESLSL